jgi:hypothetical protein
MTTSTIDRLSYGRKLVDAGIAGIRAGHKDFDPAKASSLMAHSAEESLKLAALGACLGVLPSLLQRRSRVAHAMIFSTIGGLLGFTAGFSWKTRRLTSSLAHSAMHELHRVQDEHWLEANPIDYA